jgi:subtilase family serine protease
MKFSSFSRLRFIAAATVLAALFAPHAVRAQSEPQITQAVDSAQRKLLRNTVHPLATSANDRGRADAGLPMKDMLLFLHGSDAKAAAAKQYIASLHDPKSPNYHKWLTPEQYGAQFGAADGDVAAVSQWLTSNGFAVEQVARGKNWIRFSGSAQQVERTFGTEIHQYVVNDAPHYANSMELSLPQALTPVVSGVVATHNFLKAALHSELTQIARDKNSGKLAPLSGGISALRQTGASGPQVGTPDQITSTHDFTIVGSQVVNFLSPGDFATIYNSSHLITSGNDGTGTSIAVVGRSDIALSDVEAFRTIFQLPFNDPNIIFATTDPGVVFGDDIEADLDVEWAGAIAPHATINYVVGASTNATDGVDISAAYIVDHVTAPIMSVSFGLCEVNATPAENAFFAGLWQQAAAEGITVLVAAGDSGSSGCVVPSISRASAFGFGVNALASTPDNIAVGGTEFNESSSSATYWSLNNNANQSSALGYIPEAVWNESCNVFVGVSFINCYFNPTRENAFAGGGGASSCGIIDSNGNCVGYPKPAWQTGATVPQDGVRDLPDVSLAAAGGHDGFILCTEGACQWTPQGDGSVILTNAAVVGGTSASAPSMAGIMALVEQKNGLFQGQANYVLYKLAAQPNATCDSSGRTSPGTNASCIFNDITAGANSLTCVPITFRTPRSKNCNIAPGASFGELAGYSAVPGYDLASGLGSINVANLVSAWGSVTTLPSDTTLHLSSARFAHGTPVNVNVSVSPESGTGSPTGEISLKSDKYGPAGSGTLTAGAYTASVSSLPGGTYHLTAQYAGDAVYGASNSKPISLTVTPEASTATVTTWAESFFLLHHVRKILPLVQAQLGNPFWFQVQIAGASNAGIPTGTVTLTNTSTTPPTVLGTYQLDLNGSIYISEGPGTSFDPGLGTYNFIASYSGDNSFSSTTTPFTFSIAKGLAATFMHVNNQLPAPGTTIVASAQVVGDPSVIPTGTVQFFRQDTRAFIGSPVTLDNTGTATLAFIPPPGTYFLDATYTGDGNYIAWITDHQPEIIVMAPSGAATGTTLQAVTGQPAVGRVTVYNVVTTVTAFSSSQLIPSGTVTLYSNSGRISNAATIVGGKASVPVSWTNAGPQSVYAVYSGDANFAASSSALIATNVALGTPAVTLSTVARFVEAGTQTSVSAIVTGVPQASSVPFPSGSVQFYDSLDGAAAQPLGAPVALATGNGTGVQIATLAAVLPAGRNVLSAQYLGDGNWAATRSATSAKVIVNKSDDDPPRKGHGGDHGRDEEGSSVVVHP